MMAISEEEGYAYLKPGKEKVQRLVRVLVYRRGKRSLESGVKGNREGTKRQHRLKGWEKTEHTRRRAAKGEDPLTWEQEVKRGVVSHRTGRKEKQKQVGL